MLRSKRIAALLVAVATISALISLISSSREPTYQGKSLTFWLTELQSTNGPQRQQAKRAIHEMGPKAVPALIDRLGYHTPFWRRELEYLSTRQKFFHISVIDEDAYAKLAVDGFWAANTNAIVCLPELTRMLNSRDCGRAGIALMYLGSAAIPAVTNAFASPDPHVRAAAVQWLGVNQRCFGPLWSNVLPMLKDGSVEVRHSAVQAIGQLGVHPEIAVPAMTNLLSDADQTVISGTCWGLTHFRTNAVIAVPHLLPLCQHSNDNIRYYARGAVRAISPEAAERAGIK